MEHIELTEYYNDWRDEKQKIKDHYVVNEETKEKCFYLIYDKYERPLRYCNGYYIRLDDPKLQEEYREWKKNNMTIDLYYGGGVVD